MTEKKEKTMKVRDIFTLKHVMPEGRKAIKSRLKSISLSQDNRLVNELAEVISEELNGKIPEGLKELEEKFNEVLTKVEKEASKDTHPMELQMIARSKFKDFDKMQKLQKEFEKEQKEYMKLDYPIALKTTIIEADLPKEISPQTADMAVIYMEYNNQ